MKNQKHSQQASQQTEQIPSPRNTTTTTPLMPTTPNFLSSNQNGRQSHPTIQNIQYSQNIQNSTTQQNLPSVQSVNPQQQEKQLQQLSLQHPSQVGHPPFYIRPPNYGQQIISQGFPQDEEMNESTPMFQNNTSLSSSHANKIKLYSNNRTSPNDYQHQNQFSSKHTTHSQNNNTSNDNLNINLTLNLINGKEHKQMHTQSIQTEQHLQKQEQSLSSLDHLQFMGQGNHLNISYATLPIQNNHSSQMSHNQTQHHSYPHIPMKNNSSINGNKNSSSHYQHPAESHVNTSSSHPVNAFSSQKFLSLPTSGRSPSLPEGQNPTNYFSPSLNANLDPQTRMNNSNQNSVSNLQGINNSKVNWKKEGLDNVGLIFSQQVHPGDLNLQNISNNSQINQLSNSTFSLYGENNRVIFENGKNYINNQVKRNGIEEETPSHSFGQAPNTGEGGMRKKKNGTTKRAIRESVQTTTTTEKNVEPHESNVESLLDQQPRMNQQDGLNNDFFHNFGGHINFPPFTLAESLNGGYNMISLSNIGSVLSNNGRHIQQPFSDNIEELVDHSKYENKTHLRKKQTEQKQENGIQQEVQKQDNPNEAFDTARQNFEEDHPREEFATIADEHKQTKRVKKRKVSKNNTSRKNDKLLQTPEKKQITIKSRINTKIHKETLNAQGKNQTITIALMNYMQSKEISQISEHDVRIFIDDNIDKCKRPDGTKYKGERGKIMKGSLTSNGVFTKDKVGDAIYYSLNKKEAEAFKLRTETRVQNLNLKKKNIRKKDHDSRTAWEEEGGGRVEKRIQGNEENSFQQEGQDEARRIAFSMGEGSGQVREEDNHSQLSIGGNFCMDDKSSIMHLNRFGDASSHLNLNNIDYIQEEPQLLNSLDNRNIILTPLTKSNKQALVKEREQSQAEEQQQRLNNENQLQMYGNQTHLKDPNSQINGGSMLRDTHISSTALGNSTCTISLHDKQNYSDICGKARFDESIKPYQHILSYISDSYQSLSILNPHEVLEVNLSRQSIFFNKVFYVISQKKIKKIGPSNTKNEGETDEQKGCAHLLEGCVAFFDMFYSIINLNSNPQQVKTNRNMSKNTIVNK